MFRDILLFPISLKIRYTKSVVGICNIKIDAFGNKAKHVLGFKKPNRLVTLYTPQ